MVIIVENSDTASVLCIADDSDSQVIELNKIPPSLAESIHKTMMVISNILRTKTR